MEKNFKKAFNRIAGVFLAAVLAVTMAGCADTGTALTIDGNGIAAGEYIYTQFTALSSALSKFREENPDLDTTVIGFDYYKYTVEGIPFRDWVVNETVNICKRRETYSKLFDKLGLEFTAEEKSEHKTAVSNTWNVEDSYLAYYGIDFKTWGAYYESVGISKASFQKVYEKDAKSEKVFHAYYDKGGVKEISDEELLNELKNNYARYRIITINLTDADDNALTDTAAISELDSLAESYRERLEAGELFSVVSADYELFLEERDREAHPEEYEDEVGNLDEEETEETEGTEETEEVEDENDYDYLSAKTSTSPSEEVIAHIFGMETGKVDVYKAETAYYVIMKLDVTERMEWLEEYRENLIHGLKSAEMLTQVDETAETLTLVKNQAALDRYEPKKLL